MSADANFERMKLAAELRAKRVDQKLARSQYEVSREQLKLAREQFEWQKLRAREFDWSFFISPAGVVVVGATIGLLGTAAGKYSITRPLRSSKRPA